MLRLRLLIALIVGVAVGAAMTYTFVNARNYRDQEDAALRGLLNHLAVLHFVTNDDFKQLVDSENSNIHDNLTSLRKFSGSIEEPKWINAKMRTLSAISVLWGKYPPTIAEELKSIKEDWARDWERDAQANLALLDWAKQQCLEHLEYNCKSTREK